MLFIKLHQVSHFLLAIGLAIGTQHIMKPKLGFFFIRVLPRVPGNMSLRFTGHKAPVECADIMLFKHRQNIFKSTFQRPCHILGAKHRFIETFQFKYPFFYALLIFITMKRNDIDVQMDIVCLI